MTNLARLQARFQAGILDPDADTVLDEINNSVRESSEILFGIYRYAYAARLVEVLQANFDKTWSLLGDDGFDAAARAFIAASPSVYRNARWFGDGFSEFLKSSHPDVPAIGDLAALDWAIAGAFDAADEDTVAVEAMGVVQGQDWPMLTFVLHTSVRLVLVSTDAAGIYEALGAGEPLGDLEPAVDHTVLVWRDGHTVRFRALEADEAALLHSIRTGANFATLCEIAARAVGADHAGARVAGLLRLWLDTGMIVSYGVA